MKCDSNNALSERPQSQIQYCEEEGCFKPPSFNFNFIGAMPCFCTQHKLEGMINLTNSDSQLKPEDYEQQTKSVKIVHSELDLALWENDFIASLAPLLENISKQPKVLKNLAQSRIFLVVDYIRKLNNEITDMQTAVSYLKRQLNQMKKHANQPKLFVVDSCEQHDCNNGAFFNFYGLGKGRFCFHHKENGMVYSPHDLAARCDEAACNTCLSYFNPSTKKQRTCNQMGCNKSPSFNFDYEGARLLYCVQHRLKGMVNVKKHLKCENEDCTSRCYYNFEGLKPKFCSRHKEEGMVAQQRKKVDREIKTTPSASKQTANLRAGASLETAPVLKKARFKGKQQTGNGDMAKSSNTSAKNSTHGSQGKISAQHEKTGIATDVPTKEIKQVKGPTDVRNPLKKVIEVANAQSAIKTELNIAASYPPLKPETNTKRTAKKAVNKPKQRKSLTIICRHEGCEKASSFNFKGETELLYCKTHKLSGMVNVKKNKRCQVPNCDRRCYYNFAGHPPRFCPDHRIEGMIDTGRKQIQKVLLTPRRTSSGQQQFDL